MSPVEVLPVDVLGADFSLSPLCCSLQCNVSAFSFGKLFWQMPHVTGGFGVSLRHPVISSSSSSSSIPARDQGQ
jgi:hypothetical protein